MKCNKRISIILIVFLSLIMVCLFENITFSIVNVLSINIRDFIREFNYFAANSLSYKKEKMLKTNKVFLVIMNVVNVILK